MRKTLENLTKDDKVAFLDPTDGIVVEKPTAIFSSGEVLVHYLYEGYKSTSQLLKPEEILAIGNPKDGQFTLPGWTGKYDILQPDKLNEFFEEKKKRND